jgi:hypothetical protein
VTRAGRVVKTAGLPETMRDTKSIRPDPLAVGLNSPEALRTFTRIVEMDAPLYEMEISSHFELIGPRKITIAEIEFDTILYEEDCTAKTLNWTFKNRYWVDPADGFVWRSEQTIARSFPSIELEIFKPPA